TRMLTWLLKKVTAAMKSKIEATLPALVNISSTTTYSIRASAAFHALPITSYVIELYGTSRSG
ncbi:hypothetical protein, partial [Anaerostipes hadrus]|uniref:hypothetical protein n=1 Tax=Anaerostipes hadrus TaxID=649756 RepID=UPI001EDF7F29